MAEPPCAKLPLSDVLKVLVERQLDARSRSRWTLEAAEDMATGVGVNQNRPGLAPDFGVVRVLEPVQPGVVEADIAEQMRSELLVGIETPALLDEADTVEIQRRDATGLLGRNLAADVGKGAAGSKAIGERLTILALAVRERLTDALRGVGGVADRRGHGVNRVGIDARREHPAAPIENVAPLGRRRLCPFLLALRARHEIGSGEDLQIHEPRLDAGDPEGQATGQPHHSPLERHAPVGGVRGIRHRRATTDLAGGSADCTRSITIASSSDGATR
jgi:hypothetical protein